MKPEVRLMSLVLMLLLGVFLVSSSNGLEGLVQMSEETFVNVSCPNPEGVVVPAEVTVACLAVTTHDPVVASITQLSIDLINRDKCILPGLLVVGFFVCLFVFDFFFHCRLFVFDIFLFLSLFLF